MAIAFSIRRTLAWTVAVFAVPPLALLAGALALEAGYLRHPLIALLAADSGRQIEILGTFRAHVFSRHPRFEAEHVRIGNPGWMPRGVTAEVERLALDLSVPGDGHVLRVDRLELQGASLYLVRAVDGRANWQLSDAGSSDSELPLIRSISMSQAQTHLSDARRHLQFDGIVSVRDLPVTNGAGWVQMTGSGELNGARVGFQTISDPLATASRSQPYHFTFAERSARSHLSGHGALAHAFDFDNLQTSFEAAGENLRDLYTLTGVRLVTTGNYQLSGTLQRRGTTSIFRDLQAASGLSDVNGIVSIDSSGKRPHATADLQSRVLRLSDLGERAGQHQAAAGTAPPPAHFLMSDAALDPQSLRHGDADVTYQAQRIDAAHVSLSQVSGKLSIDNGTLTVSSFRAQLLDGQLDGRLQMDASSDNPADTLELHFKHLQIGQLDHNPKGARYDALLNAQVVVTGHGRSLHALAASANGRIAMRVPGGALRESLAELSGVDVRGLGLMLAKSQHQTPIRCGAANFQAHDGTLTTDDLLLDTDAVRISGEGSLQLDTEALHLELRGHPKERRFLRVKAPVLIGGNLLHPSFGLEHPKSLQLVDRGSSKLVDCESLLAAN